MIYRETEGNPFFVEEVFHHLSEQGRLFDSEGHWRSAPPGQRDPRALEGVRFVISRRLERVSEDCRAALIDAAGVGLDFTFELLQTLCDLDADALLDAVDEAERANLIVADEATPSAAARPAETQFRFAHELHLVNPCISSLSAPRRQRLHLRVAETIERMYAAGAEAHAVDLAYHLRQSGPAADPAKTAHYLTLAGDCALA